MMESNIAGRHCRPCEGEVPTLGAGEAERLLGELPGWAIVEGRIERTFSFRNHYEAMAFVNAVAWVSHREDHHPEVTLGYRDVRVRYWTHAIGGLSENDFICAAKLDRLLDF